MGPRDNWTISREDEDYAAMPEGDERPVCAASTWSDNAAMILDVVRLGYIKPTDWVLDPTYGKGKWWTRYKHDRELFISVDRKKYSTWDFRKPLNWSIDFQGRFDVITFDPPYVSTGGRKTSTIGEMNDSYGIGNDSPRTPEEMQTLICEGMTGLLRCLKPRGLLMVKCMPYISSGKYFDAPHHTKMHGHFLGLELIDTLVHVGEPGPQPKQNPDGTPRRQVHARNNASYLLVFKKRKAR